MGVEFLATAVIGVVCGIAVLALVTFLTQITPFPRSIFILDSLLTLVMVVSSRVFVRWAVYLFVDGGNHRKTSEPVLIFGAGSTGCQLSQALSRELKYRVIAFIDDNAQIQNQVIGGIKVYHRAKVNWLKKKYDIKSVLLAIPTVSREERLDIVNFLQPLELQIKTVPGVGEIVSGRVEISKIRNIEITDLLGRQEIQPHPDLLEKNILNQVVMVTGAGGSIGAELCRQILYLKPKRLILYECNELALFNINNELREITEGIKIVACLSSVTDQVQLEKVLYRYRVNTIYHAAAYKHVPLIEANPRSGVINNIKGTLCTAQAAIKSGVQTFVLISTDKAVRPTNVMGTSKRVSELILQAHADDPKIPTRFMIVRFGNVLDSTGSVVPYFRAQIAAGKNLTVTHREITRYFMSIPEAVRLVIQAGALGKSGSTFLLDMGEPVKIYDLAVQMIKLSGLELGHDINITITGLRPGEKLYEELLIDKTKNIPTQHPKIFSAKESFVPWATLSSVLERLFQIAKDGSSEEVARELQKIVPEYTPDSRLVPTLSPSSAYPPPVSQKVIPISKKINS